MLESQFKKLFKERVKARLTGVDLDFIENNTTNRSIPDLIILGSPMWAALEFKSNSRSKTQPNQSYHVERMNAKSYARFVYPANSEEVLDDLVWLFNPMEFLVGVS